jgi:hypothetical protein
MRGWRSLGALVAILPLLPAAPTPAPDLTVLRSTLAGPPDSTWIELHPSSDTLEGTFDATYYVNTEWRDQSDRDSVRNQLMSDGFIGGYGRTFHKRSPDAYITEDVKVFPDSAHATSNWQWALNYFHDPSDTTNNIDIPAIPTSFGERYLHDPWHAIDIYFTKGNYEFTVTISANGQYMTDVATAQAASVYNFAPSHNVLAGAPKSSVGALSTHTLVLAGMVGIIVLLVVLASVLLLVIYTTRRRPPPAMRVMLSPDGNYWWDGTTWQPVTRR